MADDRANDNNDVTFTVSKRRNILDNPRTRKFIFAGTLAVLLTSTLMLLKGRAPQPEEVAPPAQVVVPETHDAPFTPPPLPKSSPSKGTVEKVFGAVEPPPPEDVPMTGRPKVKPKVEPTPAVEKAFGSIDVMAPPEGFAQLKIDGKSYGTVPGPKARGIALPEGLHKIECETSKTVYSGRILIQPHQILTVKCDELQTQ